METIEYKFYLDKYEAETLNKYLENNNRELNDYIKERLGGVLKKAEFDRDLENAILDVCEALEVDRREFDTESRKKPIPAARKVISYYLHKEKGVHKRDVAGMVGLGRTTIYNHIAQMEWAFDLGLMRTMFPNEYKGFKVLGIC